MNMKCVKGTSIVNALCLSLYTIIGLNMNFVFSYRLLIIFVLFFLSCRPLVFGKSLVVAMSVIAVAKKATGLKSVPSTRIIKAEGKKKLSS